MGPSPPPPLSPAGTGAPIVSQSQASQPRPSSWWLSKNRPMIAKARTRTTNSNGTSLHNKSSLTLSSLSSSSSSVFSTLYWESYYRYPLHGQQRQRQPQRPRRWWLSSLCLVVTFVSLYFVLSTTMAHWALMHYQEEQEQQQQQNEKVKLTTTIMEAPPRNKHNSNHQPQKPQQGKKEENGNQGEPIRSSLSSVHHALLDRTLALQQIRQQQQQQEQQQQQQEQQQQQSLQQQQWQCPLTAYLEAPMPNVVPNTGRRGDPHNPNDHGTPPVFVTPLPLRTHSPHDLVRVVYPRVQTCRDLPGHLPTDAGLQLDPNTGQALVTNVFGEHDTLRQEGWWNQSTPYCPVDQDPWLPWLHDVFPSVDGKVIHFIAQNKRRCRTGTHDTDYVNRLLPQVALMQPISVQQISTTMAHQLAPDLWRSSEKHDNNNDKNKSLRYRLIGREHIRSGNEGHNYTRFICRFTARSIDQNNPKTMVVVGETLSDYDFNYEYVSYRKRESALWRPKGKDSKLFWTSNIRFTCPVPPFLQEKLARGEFVLEDNNDDNGRTTTTTTMVDPKKTTTTTTSPPWWHGLPLLYLDLIPIRSEVRYQEHLLDQDWIGPKSSWRLPALNTTRAWGPHGHVLPDIAASGRWTNVPICAPPKLVTNAQEPEGRLVPELFQEENQEENHKSDQHQDTYKTKQKTRKKPHFLSACLWASAEFKTRGLKHGATIDTAQRLVEWLEFHLLVGFDHFYIYDNSGAHTNTTSLYDILFPAFAGKVTYINWPSQICNNNIPAADSTGERSTQYAAENSCRTRYAPFSEWMISLDTDEYLVPMGQHTSLPSVLQHAHDTTGVNILSFRSSRGKLRIDQSVAVSSGRVRSNNVTFLQAYNCDSAGSPKPEWAERARKQVYLADYVLYHFVHYSTVTRGYLDRYTDYRDHNNNNNNNFQLYFKEHAPSERPSNEWTEAVMVHTKTVKLDQTKSYLTRCLHNYTRKWQGCFVGYPWPQHILEQQQQEEPYHYAHSTKKKKKPPPKEQTYDPQTGMEYNCFMNTRLETYWIPKLVHALAARHAAYPHLAQRIAGPTSLDGGQGDNEDSLVEAQDT